jgi:hypothetical protein
MRFEHRLSGNQLFHLIDGEKAAAHMEAAHQRVFTHQFRPKARMLREEEGEPSDLTSPHYPLPFHGDLLIVTIVGISFASWLLSLLI